MSQVHSPSIVKIAYGRLLAVVCLWLLTIVSALGVVASTQEVRRAVNQLETLRREAAQLQVEWGQYLLEESTWAAYSRVEGIATQELNMLAPTSERVVMVTGDE
ncbi:MAG TPA: cell division protein FtsL [Cellvibrio sp.]|nr:cell division protein FtsL [Cellvibrio sp.]